MCIVCYCRDNLFTATISGWTPNTTHQKNSGDEITIYTLCKRHNRHAVILGINQTWMTLENTFLGKHSMLLFSDLILINLGGGKYGKIKLLNNTDKHSKLIELLKTPEPKRIGTTQKCRESSKSKTTCTNSRAGIAQSVERLPDLTL